MSDIVGNTYGELTILSIYRSSKGYLRCICQCSCGKEKDIILANLKSGKTRSCGHLEEENRRKFKDLSGKTFGELTVLEKTDDRIEGTVVWKCQCNCGRILTLSRRQLVRGYVSSCGHHKDDQLVNQKFGELSVLKISSDRKKLYCKCDCGKMVWVPKYNVLNGHTRSCGHLQHIDKFERIDGVVVSALQRKWSSRNTSGYTGVSKIKRERWVAYITLKKKRYSLGTFNDIESAIVARKNAEEKLFKPILRKMKKR